MIKLVISCVWVCFVTAAAGYAAAMWKLDHVEVAAKPAAGSEKIEYKKTRPLNVPIIGKGNVAGYVVAQFGYTLSAENAKDLSVPPEVFLLDEALQTLYSDEKLDFRHLERYDVAGLTKTLVQKVNQRLGKEVLKDVLVEELNFVAKEDIPK
jgi:flagellar basal body-associated protein FliL